MSTLQEERSAETRRKLLDAAVACLYERGYAGTTTTEIAARAGVSRGAQLHHFPRKDEMVVSALEYLFELRLAELHGAIAEPPPGDRTEQLGALVDAMWPFFKGPTFYAWLELVVASRTDPTLNEAVRAASERFGHGMRLALGRILAWPEDREADLEVAINLIIGQLESLALARVLFGAGAGDSPEFAGALESLKRIARAFLASASLAHPQAVREATAK
jgi:AcrR family transcriptional regulator